jgi:hypothetical protein
VVSLRWILLAQGRALYYKLFTEKGKGPSFTHRSVRNFHWDFWDDLENLRWEYQQAINRAYRLRNCWIACSIKLAKQRLFVAAEEVIEFRTIRENLA